MNAPRAGKGSPFHVKGIAYRHAQSYYQSHVPGGLAAVASALDDPELRAFLVQEFLSASWYDVLPFVAIDAAAARACSTSMSRFVRECAHWQAQHELSGVYRVLLRLFSPNTVAAVLPRLSAQYYDFSTVRTCDSNAEGITVVRSGLPAVAGGWLVAVGLEYLRAALELNGVREISHSNLGTYPEGEREGYELVRVEQRLYWVH